MALMNIERLGSIRLPEDLLKPLYSPAMPWSGESLDGTIADEMGLTSILYTLENMVKKDLMMGPVWGCAPPSASSWRPFGL